MLCARRTVYAALAALIFTAPAAPEAGAETIELLEGVAIGRAGRAGRSAVHTDAVEALIVAGTLTRPTPGDTLRRPDGELLLWEPIRAGDNGWLMGPALRGGYVWWTVESPRDRVMILHAQGHSLVYVNGAPRGGDPYNYGFMRLPVRLQAGPNDLLFRVGRGRLRAQLFDPPADLYLDPADRTLPDLIVGEAWGVHAGVVVVNATDEPAAGLTVRTAGGGLPVHETALPVIPPMSARKVPLWCGGAADPSQRQATITLRLAGADGQTVDDAELSLRVRRPNERHARTFISEVDGSVQYYAVTPPPEPSDEPPALYLTLHGAGVEARRQAAVYRPRPGGVVVAPTNRRKFGFDWEDWGRLDATEVLDRAMQRYGADPRRVYLTGHSMGGHGVWQVGATLPDRFAALGPSAGWVSFWSYTGATRYESTEGVEGILMRAAAPSDTVELSRNYLQHGVYILHGEKDDNVPASQAHFMNEHLGRFHPDFTYHEEPGAGHWWGDRCCDWPPMFEFFAERERPATHSVDHVEFVTASPRVSSRSDWLHVLDQRRALVPTHVVADLQRGERRFEITTDNATRLALDLSMLESDAPVEVVIDGQTLTSLEWPAKKLRLYLFADDDGAWQAADGPSPAAHKGPHRYGPFKDAFRRHMIFVYGTLGTAAENAWSYAKARYDAETFRYRGNGAVDLVPDHAFDADAERDRNVILYGNAETNGAWPALLADSPVLVRRGAVRVGDRTLSGGDLACLFIRPRPDSDTACVAAVSGSGLPGMRLTDRLPYFVSGVHYPDVTVIGPEMLTEGVAGVRAAGFFGSDWSVERGDFAWRE